MCRSKKRWWLGPILTLFKTGFESLYHYRFITSSRSFTKVWFIIFPLWQLLQWYNLKITCSQQLLWPYLKYFWRVEMLLSKVTINYKDPLQYSFLDIFVEILNINTDHFNNNNDTIKIVAQFSLICLCGSVFYDVSVYTIIAGCWE